MNIYRLESKDVAMEIAAENRMDAFVKFFISILDGKTKICEIGNLVTTYENGEEYPFRTLPVIWLLGLITDEEALNTLPVLLKTNKEKKQKRLFLKLLERICGFLRELKKLDQIWKEKSRNLDHWKVDVNETYSNNK